MSDVLTANRPDIQASAYKEAAIPENIRLKAAIISISTAREWQIPKRSEYGRMLNALNSRQIHTLRDVLVIGSDRIAALHFIGDLALERIEKRLTTELGAYAVWQREATGKNAARWCSRPSEIPALAIEKPVKGGNYMFAGYNLAELTAMEPAEVAGVVNPTYNPYVMPRAAVEEGDLLEAEHLLANATSFMIDFNAERRARLGKFAVPDVMG